jgi:hypothetical protein
MALTKVTNTGIADDAVTTDKIEDGTVVAADIAPGTIANAKLANSSITLNGSSLSLGGSATVKHIDWQALTVADGSTTLNTTAGKGYFLDTNAGVIEVFLPTSPTRGDTVVLADYSGTFATNQIIINTGGSLLDSTAGNDFKVTTNNSIVELVYVDAAKGWLVKLNQAAGTTPSSVLTNGIYDTDTAFISATGGTVTTSGDYKIHTFTGDGCFVVSCGGNAAGSDTVDYLVVAGAGGGGADMGGGGGAGGFRESHSVPVSGCYTASPLATPTGLQLTTQTYPVTVGGGGAGGTSGSRGVSGSNSVFSTITSTGGGGGGAAGPVSPPAPDGLGDAQAGGSGGGQRSSYVPQGYGPPGASGNTPPTSPPQGNPGGRGYDGQVAITSSGGGGGATVAGSDAPSAGPLGGGPGAGGDGGAGATTSISGSPTAYAGGGGGGSDGPGAPDGSGGTGGGGAGGSPTGTAGTSNTGGGGGGGISSR